MTTTRSNSENQTLKSIVILGNDVLPQDGQLWLFGSRARGDNRENSDWDLLLLVNKDKLTQQDYDTLSYPFTELGWTLNEQINPILYTYRNWQNNSFTPFYHNVIKDGIKLK